MVPHEGQSSADGSSLVWFITHSEDEHNKVNTRFSQRPSGDKKKRDNEDLSANDIDNIICSVHKCDAKSIINYLKEYQFLIFKTRLLKLYF